MTFLRWLPASDPVPLLAAAAFAAVLPASVSAATYGTVEDVARRAFPAATAFKEVLVTPSAGDAAALAAPGLGPHVGPMRTLEALQGDRLLGRVVADAVIGKFELIDYAVALGTDSHVLAVEILSYRESHGGEVRLPAWRNQFNGKGASDPIKLGADIANISGATMSCTHITDGVHRIVAWVDRLARAGVQPKAASS